MSTILSDTLSEYIAFNRKYRTAVEKDVFSSGMLSSAKPKSTIAYWIRGFRFRMQNKLGWAKNNQEKALNYDPKFIGSIFELGMISFKKKDYQKAQMYFQETISLGPELNALAYDGIGNILLKQSEIETNKDKREKLIKSAEKEFNRAVCFDNTFVFPIYSLGNIFVHQRKLVRAIKQYKKAISIDPKFIYPYVGIGNCHFLEGKLSSMSKAKDMFNQAIDCDKNFAPAWTGLGNVYREVDDSDQAIKSYKQAYEIDKNYVEPIYGIGTVFQKKGFFKKAIRKYDQVLGLDNKYIPAWIGRGECYDNLEERPNAIECYKKALKLIKTTKIGYWHETKNYYENYIQTKKEEIKFHIAADTLIKCDHRKYNNDLAYKIMTSTKDEMEKEVYENKRELLNFLDSSEKKVVSEKGNYLKILRRWNSFTPILADRYDVSRGGGYFLKINNKGFAIDPGFNFINAFKEKKYIFKELDAVFISHAHNDHTADLESILTLLHKYNSEILGDPEYFSENSVRDIVAQREGKSYYSVSQREAEKEFLTENFDHKRKNLQIFITKSTYKKYSGMFDLYKKSNYTIHIINTTQGDDIDDLSCFTEINNVSIKSIKAYHNDIHSDRDSVGFIFENDKNVLVYTGDTGWNKDIEKTYQKLSNYLKNKKIILIAHIGGFKKHEWNYFLEKRARDIFYKNHLGRIGLTKLNETLKPDVCLISEFGEELKGNRQKLACIFNETFKNEKTVFISSDIGLTVNLDDVTIEAISGFDGGVNLVKKYISPEFVCACLGENNSTLHYYDKRSVNEEELKKWLERK